jgi:phage N-6-adenine-methyltransferase
MGNGGHVRNNNVHFASDRHDWETPGDLFGALDREFRFSLDAAASVTNAKVARYYTAEDNGLAQPWLGTVWCNPPYGRAIGGFVRKGWESAQEGATVVMLVPARTDTAWWHDFVMEADEVRLLRGRLRFVGAPHCAPFPSAIVVFRPDEGRHNRRVRFSTMERWGQ